MNPTLTIDRALDAMTRGVAAAQIEYSDWSTEALYQAPEYMATVAVARALAKVRGNGFVTLESSAKDTLAEARAKGRGRMKADIRSNGRFDIVVHTSRGSPRIVVEVKCHVTKFEVIQKDVARILGVVCRNRSESTISFGAVTFMTSFQDDKTFTGKERVSKTIENLATRAGEVSDDRARVIVKHSPIKDDFGLAWSAVAIAFRPRAA